MQAASIYLVTNQIDGHTYIGVTRFTVEKRWKEHKWKSRQKQNSWFHKAIAKHGAENFTVTAVASCLSSDTAWAVEQDVILSFLPTYNQTNGGEFTAGKRCLSAETKLKMSSSQKGRKHSAERIAANSAQAKARYAANPEFKAKAIARLKDARPLIDQEKRIAAVRKHQETYVWSDESRAKLSASCMGRKHSKEIIQRMARKKDKPVECISLNTTFDSVSDAAEACGFSISGISKVCHGKRRQIHGLHFQFT